MTRVTLSSERSVLVLAPETGGGIVRLCLDGQDVLRTPPEGVQDDPLRLGEFPMAPWVNRIAHGRFSWGGGVIDLSRGPSGDPQGLHGIGWRMPWTVLPAPAGQAGLAMSWSGGTGWPFAFSMTRRFSLSARELTIAASVTNTGTAAMPFAIGFHPYFPADEVSLSASVRYGWTTDDAGIPASMGLEDVAGRLRTGLVVADENLDTCFAHWAGNASIRAPGYTLQLSTDPPLPFLQIYSPPGAGYFCLEPQSAMPDAFNRDPASGGLRVLDPGQTWTVTLSLRIER